MEEESKPELENTAKSNKSNTSGALISKDLAGDYERMLQKTEGEVRSHIRVYFSFEFFRLSSN